MFEDAEVNSKGMNAAIKAHILDDDKMREIGFTDRRPETWYFSKVVVGVGDISFNVMITKDNPDDFSIDVLDEDFLQHYDYQAILMKNPDSPMARMIKDKVDGYMTNLVECGVISGWHIGDYV